MNKPEKKKMQSSAETDKSAAPPSSAMKLPEGLKKVISRGPQQRGGFRGGAIGKPQTDFARKAGKSRKVH